MNKIIIQIEDAFNKGINPERIKMGTFESYFLRNSDYLPIAIFKPGLFRIKEECLRELSAYLLDYEHFAGVPETQIITLTHSSFGTRMGSCQLFCKGDHLGKSGEPAVTSKWVRRVAILDIRLLNIDRHPNNYLISGEKLIPIDHHLVLPTHFGTCSFSWSDWKAAQTSFSAEEKEYVRKLNPESDRRLLLDLGIDLSAANLCYFATELLKEGVKAGLTPYQFSYFLEMRRGSDLMSHFREIVKEGGYKKQEKLNSTSVEEIKKLISCAVKHFNSHLRAF